MERRDGVSIRRVEVEEGFLAGLDLRLRPGLNVLIGSRGVGKTSVIELIRFCLGVPALTDKAGQAARQQALSVLAGGRVTVTVSSDGEEFTVTRSADDQSANPRFARSVIVLSQNEIEQVGKEESGRLALVDGFLDSESLEEESQLLLARLRSLTAEIGDALDDANGIQAQITDRAHADQELMAAELQQKELLSVVAATAADQSRLDQLQTELAASSTREAIYERSSVAVRAWVSQLESAHSNPPRVEGWPDVAGSGDRLIEVRARVGQVAASLRETSSSLSGVVDQLGRMQADESQNRSVISQEAREIRVRLEAMQKGAGDVARRVSQLREQSGQAAALRSVLAERMGRIHDLTQKRRVVWKSLQELRERRATQRRDVAKELGRSLGPRVQVAVAPSEALTGYTSAIAAALRGSGLHYAALAPVLADAMDPRELVEVAEADDATALSEATGIPLDRAARVVDSIRRNGGEGIITATIEDTVSVHLQVDGDRYKPSEELSTGQRCTAILPVVLSHRGRSVLVDQPEDNLDNAYVAETVVSALRNRLESDQFILATHNPNIPVLGDADQVVVLESDGARGWVGHTGGLADPKTVQSITSIMEGGAKAFSERARLYGLP